METPGVVYRYFRLTTRSGSQDRLIRAEGFDEYDARSAAQFVLDQWRRHSGTDVEKLSQEEGEAAEVISAGEWHRQGPRVSRYYPAPTAAELQEREEQAARARQQCRCVCHKRRPKQPRVSPDVKTVAG